MVSAHPSKICASCGRTIEWRKKWERNWDDVRWCSQACRRRKITSTDAALETAIRDLLSTRAHTSSMCPSEAARAVAATLARSGDGDVDADRAEAWRELMEPARAAARRLVAAGDVVITQKGKVVDPSTAKGPIRIRRT